MPSDLVPSPDDREQAERERIPLVAQIIAIKQQQDMSWPAMGREAGITHQSLQMWATGTYQGRVDRLNESVRKYLAARQARLAMGPLAEPPFVTTPTAQLLQGYLRQAQYLPDMVRVVGAPGIGKTRTGEDYVANTPNAMMITCLAGHPSGRWLLEKLAKMLQLTERGGSQRLGEMIIDRLRLMRNPLLVIDEANHLALQTIDLVRGIHDQAKCGIALMGNHQVVAKLDTSRDAEFAQLSRRIGGRVDIKKPLRGDVDGILSAWNVADEEVVKLLRAQAARPGALGRMVKTMRMAHMMAGARGETVTAQHVTDAEQSLSGGDDARA